MRLRLLLLIWAPAARLALTVDAIMDEMRQRLVNVSALLKDVDDNIKAIKQKERAKKRHRDSRQLAVARMLLSWEGGNLVLPQTFLSQSMRSEPNTVERQRAELVVWRYKSCAAIRRSAGEPAMVNNGDTVKKEAEPFLSQTSLYTWVETRT